MYFSAPRPLIYGYLAVLNLIYLFVAVHTPITVYTGAPHDDTLFMTLGEHLSQGEWLGPYNQFTLVKGPGFPLFLAVAYWLGISVTFAAALLHCFATTIFTVVSHRFIKSIPLSALLFTFLLWHPISLSVFLLRVFRDWIYPSQVLLFLALTLGALFYPLQRQRMMFALSAGLVGGWLWLTREEGIWLLPPLGILFSGAVLISVRQRRVMQLATIATIILLSSSLVHIGFRAGNWLAYGSFVGVDFKEGNFQRALRAIHGVRSGGIEPYMSLTAAARERVYAVSPSFALLKPYFEGAPAAGWAKISCTVYKKPCDEIGVGFFIFAIRDAAAGVGRYATPAGASAFFGQIADEISAACKRGALECKPQLISEMPAVSLEQIVGRLPAHFYRAAKMLLLLNPPTHLNGSAGDEDSFARYTRFLGYPLHTRPPNIPLATYVFSGWYYLAGDNWISFSVRDPEGTLAELRVSRVGSPDIESMTKDSAAHHQRFSARTRCKDDCIVQIEGADGAKLEKKLGEFRSAFGAHIGKGQMHIDHVRNYPNPAYSPYKFERLSDKIRLFVLRNYQFALMPLLIVGCIGFTMASLRYGGYAVSNLCYLVALVSYGFVFSRMMLLIVMGVTSNTTVILAQNYAAPVYFHMVCAAVFSIAAWFQLFAHSPREVVIRDFGDSRGEARLETVG
ncbi:MAG: hypothetical protein QOI12_2759 [Alphaproteobacteria bacterium]|nr:hypothetical protein [Alphaproteobacteria bacterium]